MPMGRTWRRPCGWWGRVRGQRWMLVGLLTSSHISWPQLPSVTRRRRKKMPLGRGVLTPRRSCVESIPTTGRRGAHPEGVPLGVACHLSVMTLRPEVFHRFGLGRLRRPLRCWGVVPPGRATRVSGAVAVVFGLRPRRGVITEAGLVLAIGRGVVATNVVGEGSVERVLSLRWGNSDSQSDRAEPALRCRRVAPALRKRRERAAHRRQRIWKPQQAPP